VGAATLGGGAGEGAAVTTVDLQQIDRWLGQDEDEHLEFKEAKRSFEFEKLVKYCAALANEGGGSIVLGVTDQRPRQVVGTAAFSNLQRTKAGLLDRLHLRIDVVEFVHPGGRVLVFTSPPRPPGVPVSVNGVNWMRAGEDLVPMTNDMLRRILVEATLDFSAEVCVGAGLDSLDPRAIEVFRERWHTRTQRAAILECTVDQLLRDSELVVEDGVTYAALVLLGAPAAVGHFLAQSEVVFEYRSSEVPGPANQREEFREGFLRYYDRLWELVNLRNDRQHYQDGLFIVEVATFHERTVREAVLNAISHRDYRNAGSVFLRQYPRRLEVVSPGGFPEGIDQTNLLWEQRPRNRRIAEALGRCGLVERAGQGFDLMFRECVEHSKPLPDLARSGDHSVWVTLHGVVQDPEFLRFLEEIGRERTASFSTEDLLTIDLIHREQPIPAHFALRLPNLLEQGVIEREGRGRGTRYLLSRRFYRFLGRGGRYTRRRGLDRETNKALLLRHIQDSAAAGTRLQELQQVLPDLSRDQVRTLLRELRQAGHIEVRGLTRAARWYPVNQSPIGPNEDPIPT